MALRHFMSKHFNKILKILNFIIPFCYIAMGCVLLTDLFDNISRGIRIVFGIIIIIYGIYRIYRACAKTRDIS